MPSARVFSLLYEDEYQIRHRKIFSLTTCEQIGAQQIITMQQLDQFGLISSIEGESTVIEDRSYHAERDHPMAYDPDDAEVPWLEEEDTI